MTEEKWQDIIFNIKEKFEVLNEDSGELEGVPGSFESLEFESPLGKVKIERVIKPKLLEEKTITSKRIGADVRVEKIYSEDETVSFIRAYKKNNQTDAWEEINSHNFL